MTVIYNPTVYLNAPIFIRISMMNLGPQQRRKRTITQMSILITYKRKYSNTFYCFNTNSSFMVSQQGTYVKYLPNDLSTVFSTQTLAATKLQNVENTSRESSFSIATILQMCKSLGIFICKIIKNSGSINMFSENHNFHGQCIKKLNIFTKSCKMCFWNSVYFTITYPY